MNGSEGVRNDRVKNLPGFYFFNSALFCYFCRRKTVAIAQLVRASDCGSEGRGFEPHWPPFTQPRVSPNQVSGVFN